MGYKGKKIMVVSRKKGTEDIRKRRKESDEKMEKWRDKKKSSKCQNWSLIIIHEGGIIGLSQVHKLCN